MPLLLALALFCSNPVKDVQWRTSVDLPITAQKKFYLGAMMDTLFFNKNQVLTSTTYDTTKDTIKVAGKDSIVTNVVKNVDTTMTEINGYPKYDATNKQIPDTVSFGFPTHDTAADTISEDSLADKYFEDVFGPIPISNTPTNAVTVPLNNVPYVAGTPVSSPAAPLTVKYVYQVMLDTAQTLGLTVTNNTSVDLDSVQVTLGTVPASTSTIYSLAHGTSGIAQFNVSSKEIDSVLPVSMTLTPSSSGTFTASDNISASFSMNGLNARKVVVLDSLLKDYTRTFTNEYNLTDTVDVGYIDIATGFFIYSITNYTNLDMLLSVTHLDLWRTDFCQGKNPPLQSVNDLVGLTYADSFAASNCDIAVKEQFPANQTNQYSKHNISANRLFAMWDPVTQKSVTKVNYQVNIGAYGRKVTLSAGDSLQFVIRTTSFKFKEMYGTSMDQYKRVSKPSVIPVNLPWTKSVTDSLRGHFILQKVLAVAKTRINIPQGAFIDTMNLHYVLSSVTNPGIACSSDVALVHVTRDSTFTRPIDITNVVNDYPDSVKVNVSLTIPVNTTLRIENDLTDPTDPRYTKYIGRMIIHGLVDYNLVAPLCWTVADTTIMDLGGSKVDLSDGSGVIEPIDRMTDKHGSLNVQVTNNTNVDLRLYALVATADTEQVDSLIDTGYVNKNANTRYVNSNEFNGLINVPTPGFVKLLGSTGLLIPARDPNNTVLDVVTLTDTNLTQILGAKTIGLRWEVRFIPHSPRAAAPVPDALNPTDWIKLNSWIHIDGINTVNTLSKKAEEK